MSRSVSQEMSAEQRRKELLDGLEKASNVEEVVVNFSHLAHAVGMDTAESLIHTLVSMEGLVATPYSRKPRLVSQGMCSINPQDAIDAIKRVQERTERAKIDQLMKRKPN